ncbi:MAG: hypothetical protein J5I81_12830 [Nitrococcus mobilis]|nr:hypothetical protein [Nitrococcus mobilis]
MKNRYPIPLSIAVLALTVNNAALAYVGPGAGLSLLGALWGLLIAVGAALAFVIFWPLRQLRKRARAKRAAAETQTRSQTAEQDSAELRRRAP